jgi:hypothetical protein
VQLLRRVNVQSGGKVAAVHLVHQFRMGLQEAARPGVARYCTGHSVPEAGVDDQRMTAPEPAACTLCCGSSAVVSSRGDPARTVGRKQPPYCPGVTPGWSTSATIRWSLGSALALPSSRELPIPDCHSWFTTVR